MDMCTEHLQPAMRETLSDAACRGQGWAGRTRANAAFEGSVKLLLIGALHLLVIAVMAAAASRPQPKAMISRLDVRVIEEQLPRAAPTKPALLKPAPVKAAPRPPVPPAPGPVQPPAPAAAMSAAAEAPVAAQDFAIASQTSVPAPSRSEIAAPAPAPARAAAPPAITPPRFDAVYLHNPAPAYPRASRVAGHQGQTVLTVLVSEQGVAVNVQVERSSGFARLDEAALDAVKQWRFVPAKRGAEAIAEWVLVPITFRINA